MMKGFKRSEKGFTLIELLIVVAILGVLAAVVIPNVVGLLGRGSSQAFETDEEVIQLAAATFFADTHAGWGDPGAAGTPDDSWITGPAGFTTFNDNVWGDSANNTLAGHYYPTAIGRVGNHILTESTVGGVGQVDPDNSSGNPLVLGQDGVIAATDDEMKVHAIWMGLLVNAYDSAYNQVGGFTGAASERWKISSLSGESSLYLNEMPKSAMAGATLNGNPGPKGGGYLWVVGKNGVVYGTYQASDNNWYSGFSGAYP